MRARCTAYLGRVGVRVRVGLRLEVGVGVGVRVLLGGKYLAGVQVGDCGDDQVDDRNQWQHVDDGQRNVHDTEELVAVTLRSLRAKRAW